MNAITSAVRVEQIGNATLYLGDCREVMPGLVGVDGVVCDPPYGISHKSGGGPRGKTAWQDTQIANDNDTSYRDFVVDWLDDRPGAFCGSWKIQAPRGTRAAVVWDKGPAFGMGDLSLPWKPSWEFVFVVGHGWKGRRGEGVLRGSPVWPWVSAGRVHPHQKPDWLMGHFIERLPDAKTILDPFMGSGSTGVACLKLGRKFIGIEIDPGYFQIACDRLRMAHKQPDLWSDQNAR